MRDSYAREVALKSVSTLATFRSLNCKEADSKFRFEATFFIFLQNVIVDLFDIVRLFFSCMQIGIHKISENRKLRNIALSLSSIFQQF